MPTAASSYYQQQQQRADLLQVAKAFCASFAEKKKTPEEIVDEHFSSSPPAEQEDGKEEEEKEEEILAYEHGLPQLAPFLGRPFRGREGVLRYFRTLAECLSYEGMRFPAAASACDDQAEDEGEGVGDGKRDGDKGWIIDIAARKVSVKGQARFTWTATGESWDEVFAYVLTFDDGEVPKVKRYEVWADTGAAWLASRGELGNVRGGEG